MTYQHKIDSLRTKMITPCDHYEGVLLKKCSGRLDSIMEQVTAQSLYAQAQEDILARSTYNPHGLRYHDVNGYFDIKVGFVDDTYKKPCITISHAQGPRWPLAVEHFSEEAREVIPNAAIVVREMEDVIRD